MKPQDHDAYYEVVLGPIKIKDGLFMGDELAARDIQFIISNKVTHIINTVSNNIGNLWQKFGVHYLSVGWTEYETNVFDENSQAINAICNFIQQTSQKGQSCLVHSINGKTRASVIIIAYLMKKYNWSLAKAMQLVESRKDGLMIRQNYHKQLQQLEWKLLKESDLNSNWHKHLTNQEQLINNTYKNSVFVHEQYYQLPPQYFSREKAKRKKRVQWKQPSYQNKNSQIIQRVDSKKQLKPILKEQQNLTNKVRYYFNERDSSQRDSNKKNLSDSLDKLLFQSTRRNIMFYSDDQQEGKHQNTDNIHNNINQHYFRTFIQDGEVNKYTPSREQVEIKKTAHHKKTLQTQQIEDPQLYEQLQDDKCVEVSNFTHQQQYSIKKVRHYDRVMACYKALDIEKDGKRQDWQKIQVLGDDNKKGKTLSIQNNNKIVRKLKKKIKCKNKLVQQSIVNDQSAQNCKVYRSTINYKKIIGIPKALSNKSPLKKQPQKRRPNSAGKIKGSNHKNSSNGKKSKCGYKTSTILQTQKVKCF